MRTVLDVARTSPPDEGVVAADAALHAGACTRDELRAALAACRGRTGVALARRAVELCRAGAESPMETRLRLLVVRAGLPEPVLQHRVQPSIGELRLDQAWPDRQLCLEYDGYDPHTTRHAFARDRVRWRALAAVGWQIHPVTYAGVRHPARLVAELRSALGRSVRR